jgi:hypothetical protein
VPARLTAARATGSGCRAAARATEVLALRATGAPGALPVRSTVRQPMTASLAFAETASAASQATVSRSPS